MINAGGYISQCVCTFQPGVSGDVEFVYKSWNRKAEMGENETIVGENSKLIKWVHK